MGKKSDDDTAVILKKLGIICPSFYAMYYVVVVVLALAFGLECDDKDSCRYYRLPFYFDEDDFRPEGADLAELCHCTCRAASTWHHRCYVCPATRIIP